MVAATPPVVSRRLGEQAPMQLSCILEVKPGLDEPVHPVSLILFFVPSWTLMHMGVVRGNDNKIYNNQNMCFALTGSHPSAGVSSAMGCRYAPLEPGSILSVAIMAGLGDTSSPPSAIFIVGAIRWVTAMHREIENSIQNVCLVGTKFREENDDDARKFALLAADAEADTN